MVWEAPTQQDTFVWRGTIEAGTLREFFADTAWGELDFLLIDLPPGPYSFSTVAQLIPDMIGIMVTIPSEVARLVVRKFTALAQESKIPLVGLVENMAGYVCPHCGELGELFYADGNGEMMAAEFGIPHLGKIPFDPKLQISTDWGVPFVLEHGDSPAGKALTHVAGKLKQFLEEG